MARNSGKRRKEQSLVSKVLASSNKKRVVMKGFFEKLSLNEIRAAVPSLVRHRHFKDAISIGEEGFSSIYIRMTPKIELAKNVAWCVGMLSAKSEKIVNFMAMETEILNAILAGDQNRALEHLSSLDDQCGVSIWSVGVRGAVLALDGRTEEKRALLGEINASSASNRFLKTVAGLVATKYEDNATLPAFNNFAEQKIRRGFSGELLHFLMYKIVPINYEFPYDYSYILEVEKNTSPLDVFCCLLDLVRYSIYTSHQRNFRTEAEQAIRHLCRIFPSEKMYSLANDFGIETIFEFSPEEINLLDLYTAGNYEGVCEYFESKPELSYKFGMFEIWVKSACRTGRFVDGFLGELMRATASIIIKDEYYEASLARVLLICQAFGMLSWFKELHIFVVRQTRFISKEINARLEKASIVNSGINSPLRISTLPFEVARIYEQAMIAEFPNSAVVGLFGGRYRTAEFMSGSLPDFDIDRHRLDKYLAIRMINAGMHSDAIQVLTWLTLSEDVISRNEAHKLLVETYIEMNEVEMAVVAYVKIVMANYSVLRTFDSQTLCESAKTIIKESKEIGVSIAFSLHSKNINGDFDAALKFAFEQFLKNNGCESPLELFDREEEFDKAQLYYFLEYVCTPEVMKLYFYFDSPKDIEECRIEICKRLIERNHSQETLVFEVKERTKRQVILKAAKHVENSRIYSDTSSLVNAANFRQLYEAFSVLRTGDFSDAEDEIALSDFLKKLEDMSSTKEFEDALPVLHIQDLVLNEKNSIFLRLIKLIRDEFTFGVKGLNGHLSTRIRHGHLPNTLRKCIADQGLVSPKISATGGFKKNIYWYEKFSYLSEPKVLSLDKELSDFSAKLFELINEVNDKWLQIVVYDQDIAGLGDGALDEVAAFNYSTTFAETFYLQRFVSQRADYIDFVKVVIAWLWRRTESNLAYVREKIDEDLRKRLIKLLDQLEKSVFAIAGSSEGMAEFSDAIATSRRKVSASIDLIKGWFNRSQGISIPLFDSDVVISIAKWSAGAQVDHEDTTNLQFRGDKLSYFVDALYVLLENCVTKSNLNKEQMFISTSFAVLNGDLYISVVNNCFPVDSIDESNEQLDFYRDSYGQEEFAIKAAQGEGGSGFFKVWKSLAKDLDLEHSIDFGYSKCDEFKVVIGIPASQVAKVLCDASIDN